MKETEWLAEFASALRRSDIDAATALFADECYWRDLVAFTWNIKTMEGKDQVRVMLTARLADTSPSNWRIPSGEDATEADGVIESWIEFETGLARGLGHLRIKDGRIWTLLTTMAELKGHEEAQGAQRPMGVKHGIDPGRKSWKEQRDRSPSMRRRCQPAVGVASGEEVAMVPISPPPQPCEPIGIGGTRQAIAAAWSAHALDQSGPPQSGEQLLEVGQRDFLPGRNVRQGNRLGLGMTRQINHRHYGVTTLGAELHSILLVRDFPASSSPERPKRLETGASLTICPTP